ncbi:MAG: protein translocase subunit SecF [Candidatus Jorgensenbacteria bacterium]|nr:protein translocase subunit SecF [Candidatus Jorgensenbacteria bacterium]
MLDVINKKYLYLGFSVILVLASWILIFSFGLRQGIDLTGGTQWQIAFSKSTTSTVAIDETLVQRAMLSVAPEGTEVLVKRSGESFIIRLPATSEEGHQAYRAALHKLGVLDEQNFSSIGPTIGHELRQKSIWAIILVLFGISLYIAYAFRKVSRPISSWKYGLATLVSLFHDVSIPAGLLAFLGWYHGIEIDTNFIVALLVVMGFSVHDTIVVFDRIRENVLLSRGGGLTLHNVIVKSIRETFARSVNTSLTLILVLLALVFFGPPSLFYFVLTILVGTVFGTYSSIFVASPILFLLRGRDSG